MAKYKGNWELAATIQEEIRLARDAHRHGRAEHEAKALESHPAAQAAIHGRFRRVHPDKKATELHSMVFVNQSAMRFGRFADPPRERRAAFVLRHDHDLGTLLCVPMTTRAEPNPQRKLPVPRGSDGLQWLPGANPRDGYVYDSPEYVAEAEIRTKDLDSPSARLTQPLLGQLLSFVFMPKPLTNA